AQAGDQFRRRRKLGMRGGGIQLLTAAVGAQQQAGPGAQSAVCSSGQLDAKTAVTVAHVVAPTLEVAEAQRAVALGGAGLHPSLPRGVVQPQLLITTTTGLAVAQGLALEAGKDGIVVVP